MLVVGVGVVVVVNANVPCLIIFSNKIFVQRLRVLSSINKNKYKIHIHKPPNVWYVLRMCVLIQNQPHFQFDVMLTETFESERNKQISAEIECLIPNWL